MMQLKMNKIGGNWETVGFILINKLVSENDPRFSRSELMTTVHLDLAVWLTSLCGHKKNPKACEQTLQRTLQNMRDKGFINFLGLGEYKLTKAGYVEMDRLAVRFPYSELLREMKKHPIIKGGSTAEA